MATLLPDLASMPSRLRSCPVAGPAGGGDIGAATLVIDRRELVVS